MIDNELNGFDDLLSQEEPQETEAPEEGFEHLNPDLQEDENENSDSNSEYEGELPTFEDNGLYSYLQERGIDDPSRISISEEDGEEREVDFNNLSPQDQLDLLRSVADPGLSYDEINTINYLRQNGASLGQIVNYFSQQAVQNYIASQPVPEQAYTVDEYSDDDLFLIDLKNRFPEMTDDELVAELDSAKANEDTFAKKTETIRNNYKAMQDQAALEAEAYKQQQIEDLKYNLASAVDSFNEIQLDMEDAASDSLVIEDSDKQQIMSYLLDQDSTGKSQLAKDLEDPDLLVEIAWFRTQGPKVISDLTHY